MTQVRASVRSCYNAPVVTRAVRRHELSSGLRSQILLLFFFFCVAIGQEITHKTSYMSK